MAFQTSISRVPALFQFFGGLFCAAYSERKRCIIAALAVNFLHWVNILPVSDIYAYDFLHWTEGEGFNKILQYKTLKPGHGTNLRPLFIGGIFLLIMFTLTWMLQLKTKNAGSLIQYGLPAFRLLVIIILSATMGTCRGK